jgi:hypothetical protein
MKRIPVRIGVALLAFFVGVVASTITLRLSADSHSPMSSQDEEWHRLYEAAGMSGDSTIRQAVYDRLLCANKAGVPDALPIEIQAVGWCQRADGTIHELLLNDTSEYGSFYRRITSSHSRWALENLDFVRTVGTGKKAKEYVATHQLPYLAANRFHP